MVVYTWLCNTSGGCLLVVTLFHGGVNVWESFVALYPSETGETSAAVAITTTEMFLAVVLVVAFGAATLVRGGIERPAYSDSQS